MVSPGKNRTGPGAERTAGPESVIRKAENPRPQGETIAKIVRNNHYVEADVMILDLADALKSQPDIPALAVVDADANVRGIITRRNLFGTLAKPFGRDLLSSKTVAHIAERVASFNHQRNIFSVAEELSRILHAPEDHFFLLTRDDRYFGSFSTRDLLIYLSTVTQKDIALARNLQKSLVPERTVLETDRFTIAGMCTMAKGVGGDLYDVRRCGDGEWIIAVCDVSGKGVSASLVTTGISGMINAFDFSAGLDRFIAMMNRYLVQSFSGEKFVTGFFASFNETTGELDVYDAGHSLLYLRRRGKLYQLRSSRDNIPLGISEETVFASDHIVLIPGDILLVLTDGIIEQTNGNGDQYGVARLSGTVCGQTEGGAAAIADEVLKDVRFFRGTQPVHDDMTILALEYR